MTEIKQPKIRFKGHISDWEHCKLGDYKDVRDGTHDSPKYHQEGHPLVTSKNLNDYGLDMTDVSLISDVDFEAINKRSKVDNGDILFGMIGTIGNPVIVDRSDFAIKNVALIKEGGNIPNRFLIQLLKSSVFEKYIRNENAGNTQKFLGLSKIREFTFFTPTIDEQNKIGEFFKTLDGTIALHQQKLEVTKQFKQTMLKKMFPKNGETTPEIRFKGFTGDWEEFKLKDLCSLSTGKLDANAMTSDGKYTFFTSGEKVYKTDTFAFDGDAILIAGNGNVGLQHKFKGKFNAYQRTYVLMDFKAEKELIYNQISLNLPHILSKETRTGVIPYIVINMLKNLEIRLPKSKKEQELIGKVFLDLDTQISSLENKLDIYKQFKKAMLQKMFV